uniref:Uncharacterized protein n=1 Tax=Rhizophora mucronata TaxID=61149 RepID=A0A2P2NEB4_RHIMU
MILSHQKKRMKILIFLDALTIPTEPHFVAF